MTAQEFAPLPAPGDIVYCRFPQKVGTPGPKPRPALVVAVGFSGATKDSVRVAYGTSKGVDRKFSGEFEISPVDGEAFRLSGLSFPTKFDLKRTHVLPYNEEWFAVPPQPEHGQTPKLGTLHPSLMKRAQTAYDAATRGADEESEWA